MGCALHASVSITSLSFYHLRAEPCPLARHLSRINSLHSPFYARTALSPVPPLSIPFSQLSHAQCNAHQTESALPLVLQINDSY